MTRTDPVSFARAALVRAVLPVIVSFASQPALATAPEDVGAEDLNRRIVAQFASCVVQKHHKDAAHLVLALGVNHVTAQTIADPTCATTEMFLPPAAFQSALADALVKSEFPAFDGTLIEGVPPLLHPVLNEGVFASKIGNANSPEDRQKIEQNIAILREGIAFSHFGECVVRASPAEAHALLMTKVTTAEEADAIQNLRHAFARCPGLVSRLDQPAYLRGVVAENYYRLAHCGRNSSSANCDPNEAVVTPAK